MAGKYNRKQRTIEILLRDNPYLKNDAKSLMEAYNHSLEMEKMEADRRRASREVKEQANAS